MAEQECVQAVAAGDEEDENDNPDYKPPAPKSLGEILEADQEDESLRKYKVQLLGQAADKVIVDPGNPNCVLVKKLIISVDGRDDIELDLTLSPDQIKKNKVIIKEGCKYRVRIQFYVQRDIVSGLQFEQKVFRKGVRVDKLNHMVGSYAPKLDMYTCSTRSEEAPCGMLTRGEYKMESRFTDDDKHVYLQWEWYLVIKKEFE